MLFVNPSYKDLIYGHLINDFKALSPIDRVEGRAKHGVYEISSEKFIVKRYQRGGAVSWLGQVHFTPRKVLNEIAMNQIFRKNGLNVPEIIAAKVSRTLVIFKMIIVEKQVQGTNLYDLINRNQLDNKLVRLTSSEIKKMHFSGIKHGDLNLKNIIITPTKEVFFIDLSRSAFAEDGIWEIARLNRSCEKLLPERISNRMKLIFLLGYSKTREELDKAFYICESELNYHKRFWVTFHGR